MVESFPSSPDRAESPSLARGQRPAIRTMKSDVEQIFKSTKPSLLQIISQESTQAPAIKSRGVLRANRLFNVGIVTLVVVLLGATAYFIFQPRAPAAPLKLIPPAPLFATESSRTISADTKNSTAFLRLIEDASRETERQGTVKRIIIKLQDGPTARFATLADLFQFWKIAPPPNFLGELGTSLMTFFYFGTDGARFGIAVPTKDADRTLASLLSWEPQILADISPLLFDEKPEVVVAPFEDRTYRNIDWRYLKLSSSRDLGIGYLVFPAKNILVLTTSKEAMETIINRMFDAR